MIEEKLHKWEVIDINCLNSQFSTLSNYQVPQTVHEVEIWRENSGYASQGFHLYILRISI